MVLMAMFSVMLYRVAVIVSMYESTKRTVFSPYASLITSMTASIINLIAIVVLNYVILIHFFENKPELNY
jgi:hypothetical protein